jgi:hypothetical protein
MYEHSNGRNRDKIFLIVFIGSASNCLALSTLMYLSVVYLLKMGKYLWDHTQFSRKIRVLVMQLG